MIKYWVMGDIDDSSPYKALVLSIKRSFICKSSTFPSLQPFSLRFEGDWGFTEGIPFIGVSLEGYVLTALQEILGSTVNRH